MQENENNSVVDVVEEAKRLNTHLNECEPHVITVKKVRTCDDGTECLQFASESAAVLRWFYKNFCLYNDVLYMSLSEDSKTLDMELAGLNE